MARTARLADYIRDVPDFPKPGILFKDITTLLQDGAAFKEAVDTIAAHYKGAGIDKVVAVEARGFIFGGAVACSLGCGIVPVRKKGKLPWKTTAVTYDLEYGQDTLEMHDDAVDAGERVLVIDDVLATGGTTKAVCELLARKSAKIAGIAFLIELQFLKGREKLGSYPVFSIITY